MCTRETFISLPAYVQNLSWKRICACSSTHTSGVRLSPQRIEKVLRSVERSGGFRICKKLFVYGKTRSKSVNKSICVTLHQSTCFRPKKYIGESLSFSGRFRPEKREREREEKGDYELTNFLLLGWGKRRNVKERDSKHG